MTFEIPEFGLIALIGASGVGKSTFAAQHFLPTEVISSDACRAMISDDPDNLSVTPEAFDLLYTIVGKRLELRKLTVVDATNVKKADRQRLVKVAKAWHAPLTAIVFNLPLEIALARSEARTDRSVPAHAVRRHHRDMRRSIKGLRREGFRHVFVLDSPEEVEAVTISRQKLWVDKREETGPFDIIGDVHSCFDELVTLLGELGYTVTPDPDAFDGLGGYDVTPPVGRRAIFLGDFTDRGPQPVEVLKLAMGMVEAGSALAVPGNHDIKLERVLRGKRARMSYGLKGTMAALEAHPEAFRDEVRAFIYGLVSHYVLDAGRLVVAHAGMKEDLAGRASGRVREFALFGETTGERDEFGLPVRLDWAADYRGKALVVYGHTPVPQPRWLNNTVNIDTGCCFGGALTALRYPEGETVTVPAKEMYYEPAKPFLPEEDILSAQQTHDTMLDMADVSGKRFINTALWRTVTIEAENAAAALEVMGRFAVDPRWLAYLPPTMSPVKTSSREGLLEHPDEAFSYYREVGVAQVICEEKHMGSRAVVVVCRTPDAARERFGMPGSDSGVVYTRTGRRFFDDRELEAAFLARLRTAAEQSGLWEDLATEWMILDCELMPWSQKAQGLIERQYAAVGAAARTALDAAVESLRTAPDAAPLLARYQHKRAMVAGYSAAYRPYCWPVESLDDLTLAPFHLMATEDALHTDKDHRWHMETLARLCAADEEILLATPYHVVDLNDAATTEAITGWWEKLTASGGEGMVVKPLDFIARDGRGKLIQPAVKVRGREYLRLIYGPEYTAPDQIKRLRSRGLGRKRSLALREFALGVEGLTRFVKREPLRRTHECVFGVLALESEPVDPRL